MQDDLNDSNRRWLLADQLLSHARLASFSGMCTALPMALLLLIRRMVGGMSAPLTWPVALLLACVLPLALFLACLPWYLGRPAARWRVALVGAGWVLAEFLMVMAVSLRGTGGGALALIWAGWGITCGAVLAIGIAVGRRPRVSLAAPGPWSVELARPSAVAEPAPVDVEVPPNPDRAIDAEPLIARGADQTVDPDPCSSDDLADDQTQRWTRGISAAGDAFVAGQFRVRLPAGHRLVHFHLPIWPPLREPLTVEAEVIAGEDVDVTVGQCLPQGVRWDLRCAQPFANDAEIVVAVYVTEAAADPTLGDQSPGSVREPSAPEFP